MPSIQENESTAITPTDKSADDALVELVEALAVIDEDSPLATENATSISDNNGGRIKL